MFEARKEYPLPHIGLQEQKLFFVREVKRFLQVINRRRRLLEQNLDGRVGNHREAVRRLEDVLHVAHGKDDELFVDIDVGRLVDKARPGAFGVFREPLYQRVAPLQAREHHLKVGQKRRLYLGKVAVDSDVFERVGLCNGPIDDGVLLRRKTAEHNAEHPHQRHDVGAQDIGRRLVLARRRQVERIYVIFGVKRYIEVASADGLRQKLILALGVDDDNLGVEHQRAQNFQLGGVAFAGAGLGKDDRVVVLERKAVKKHQGGVVAVDSVQYPLVGGKVKRYKRKYTRER